METKKKSLFRRRAIALKIFILSKTLRKKFLKLGIKYLYTKAVLQKNSIPCINIEDLTLSKKPCNIFPFSRVDGNLSLHELVVLTSLVQELKPKRLLEIGTFNGLTTLHMAINAPENAIIHTLDLLKVDSKTPYLDPEDIKYIENKEKNKKKYTHDSQKIKEHYGNSLTYPFESFDNPDFIFIDGSHSYPMVKNDTEKSLKILKKGGVILWHDYTPDCLGVFNYLNELKALYPIFRIKNTSLAYLHVK